MGVNILSLKVPQEQEKTTQLPQLFLIQYLKTNLCLSFQTKKKALDVVEDKITETINKVRHDKNFQNPILRLGKTGNTYSQILATASIENIKTHFRAVKKDYDAIESYIEKLQNTLKKDLKAEILTYEEIDLKEIHELLCLEFYYQDKGFPVDIEEVLNQQGSAVELEYR